MSAYGKYVAIILSIIVSFLSSIFNEMASSAGFSIATSPPGGFSPQKSGRQNSARKTPSAAQLLDQIRNLDAEGNKLRSDSSGVGKL